MSHPRPSGRAPPAAVASLLDPPRRDEEGPFLRSEPSLRVRLGGGPGYLVLLDLVVIDAEAPHRRAHAGWMGGRASQLGAGSGGQIVHVVAVGVLLPGAKPAADWSDERSAEATALPTMKGLLALMTGELSLEQVNLIFTHLPVDLSFVDETDAVRFYSEGPERIFPHSPAVVGRKVQNCHPPKSVHIVEEILGSFRAGQQSVAEFWIQLQGKFIHIRHFPIRDREGTCRGCFEVCQEATAIRAFEAERRLLQWHDDASRERPSGVEHLAHFARQVGS